MNDQSYPESPTLKAKFRSWVNRVLEGTHQHFLCYLPGRSGAVASWFLKVFYAGIRDEQLNTEVLADVPDNAIIVYLTKRKSHFEFLFYYRRYRDKKIPFPEIGIGYTFLAWQPISRIFRVFLAKIDYLLRYRTLLDPYNVDYFKEELSQGRVALLSLVEKKGFYRRFVKSELDPLQRLVEIQKSINKPIYLVPQTMFFGKRPNRSHPTLIDILFGTQVSPGKIRKLVTLVKSPQRIFVEMSEPVNLQAFISLTEVTHNSSLQQSVTLRQRLLELINRHRQSITGPRLKSREELKESILTSKTLRDFMDQHAVNRDLPRWKIYKKAAGYIDEIAAKYNPAVIRIASVAVRWLISAMFEGVSIDKRGLSRVKQISQRGPLVLIPCHKSHIDYLILSYVLFNHNMPVPHVAAGKNLSFWPMGPIFRAGGAFFIRRSFRGAVLYSKVFAAYIHKLLEEGYNIEQFIEGGRSRTGKLLMPKLGLLSILLNAYKNGACEDMVFVPVFIGYDRILEEKAYIHEIEGGKKEPENLKQVIKARKFLRKRFGKIYINFHDPLSLNELLGQKYKSDIKDMSNKEQNALCRDLGWRIINSINSVSVVTAHALTAGAILNCGLNTFDYKDLTEIAETYLHILRNHEAQIANTVLVEPERAIQHVIEDYAQSKFIERVSKDKEISAAEATYRINVGRRPILEYYKNNCVSYFIPAAFTALAILERDAFQFTTAELHETYTFLRSFFKYEFAYNLDQPPEFFVRRNIKAFIDDAIIIPHPTIPDTYNLTSSGLRKLKLLSRFLKTYFESYWVVLQHFKKNSHNSVKSKDRLKKIQNLGSRMYKRNAIELSESMSKINYVNAIDYFTSHRVKGSENVEQITFYEDTIHKFRQCIDA